MMCCVRPAVPEDAEAVYRLICELNGGGALDKHKFMLIYLDNLQKENICYFVVPTQGVVVGFISMSIGACLCKVGDVAMVEEMIVDEQYRGQGFGKALMETAVECAKARQCCAVWLTSGFARTGAHAFYEAQGFIKNGYRMCLDFEQP